MPLHDWTRVSAGTYHDFHGTWIVELKRRLNGGILPADYYAMGEQVAGSIGPDVLTLQTSYADEYEPPSAAAGGVALAEAPPKVYLTDVWEEDLYAQERRTLVIRHSSEDRLVALIEILSPGNKSSRHAMEAIVRKITGVLRHGLHVLVIDPFPPTSRDPDGIHPLISREFADRSFIFPPGKSRTLASYVGGNVKQAYVQPVAVGDDLGEMPLFLTPEIYVNVPLETSYRAAFDAEPARWRSVLEQA